LVRTYRVGLGFSPVADKQREGDGATPEGEFYVFVKNNKSAYYLSLGISYPNVEDADRGLRDGLINETEHAAILDAIRKKKAPPQYTKLGGLIYIHGNGSSKDWTWGCVALENNEMKELYDAVTVGTPVTIKP
jgi:murein L,D-transpeptidase YafK